MPQIKVDPVYVEVVALHRKDGIVQPLFIVWEDEEGNKTKYRIDKITYYNEMIPGHFVYHVMISGHERPLHYALGQWYVVTGLMD